MSCCGVRVAVIIRWGSKREGGPRQYELAKIVGMGVVGLPVFAAMAAAAAGVGVLAIL